MKRGHLRAFLVIAAAAIILLATPALAQLPPLIRVGVAVPLTGPIGLNGQEVKEAADLAVDILNRAGGIKGKTKVELVYGDTRCVPTDGVTVTQRMLSQGIDFYIGNYCSSVALATMPILAGEGIPQIVLAFANSITEEARTPNSVRIGPNANIDMGQLAKFAVTVKGNKKFAAIGLNNDYGRSMVEAFAKSAERYGGKVIDAQYAPFGADFATFLTKIKNSDADAVVCVTMGNDTVAFTKSYFELGMKINIFTNCNFDDTQYLENQKPKPTNLYYSDMFDDGSARSSEVPEIEPWIKDFIDKFKAKYNKIPNRNNAWGPACLSILEQAIANTGTIDKKKIAEYLHSGAKFKTTFGNFGFEWCGQALNECGVGTFKDDKKYFVKPKGWAPDVLVNACPPK
jgi:branched-chain amino acid transport system substrate-binding protein